MNLIYGFTANPKWIVGLSDNNFAFSCFCYANTQSIHGQMPYTSIAWMMEMLKGNGKLANPKGPIVGA